MWFNKISLAHTSRFVRFGLQVIKINHNHYFCRLDDPDTKPSDSELLLKAKELLSFVRMRDLEYSALKKINSTIISKFLNYLIFKRWTNRHDK